MADILLPREGSKWVMTQAKDVKIIEAGVKKVNNYVVPGYWALCAAVNRALAEGKEITSAQVFSKITKEELKHVLRSDTEREIPLLDERVKNLHQAGKVIMELYDGSIINMVKAADKSAMKLLDMIVSNIESFRDTAMYEGKRVALYKRAQILIADIWAACEGRGLGEFTDIDELTMFADYRIPQVLCWFGVLDYSVELMEKLKSKHVFNNGDREEVELRAASIKAVEMIVKETKALLKNNEGDYVVNSSVVDFYLWEYRREKAKECDIIPFHRCRCIYY
ncbi:DgyrCDS12255 [Dimorphilus gyrociliatus]|uniref:Queuosine 5'-phosphate N-glycosylase/hydrolase n=1 Tax=Dimorphilus gyrociliatus TaxID=2664684 RepID=A0A7I8W7Z4_9ANNE|nr:DgyrCDS12255 [Dimorphilus gyrociliatus]